MKRLELELEEEKSSVEMLTDRVARSRDQIDQLRSELMQERSSKQDLELDKNAMERHVCTYVISESIDVCDNQTEVFSLKTDTPLHLNLGDTLTHYPCVSLQLKELRSRIADIEGQSRSSAGVSQLENKIQELEERLRGEERYC